MKNFLFVLVFFISISFSVFSAAANYGSGISEEQKALLETLPEDQRESILIKMRQAQDLGDELEETFREVSTLIERPEKKVLTKEEAAEYSEKSKNWIYGYEQFQTSPTTFAPTATMAVPSDFLLGPGDEITVQYYGNESSSFKQNISRSGQLNLPLLGPITLAGLTFSEAQDLVKKKISNELIGTSVDLTLGKLRSITVYILGEAYSPGSYTVSSLSSLTNLLFVSGGVNEKGSVRNIQVKRKGETVHVFDLYELLLKGDIKSDVRLQAGDVVFVPLIKKTARAEGFFRRPSLYEIKDNDDIEDLVFYAGGFTPRSTENAKLELSRINGLTKLRELSLFNFYDEEKISMKVKDGDSIKAFEYSSLEESSILVYGEVKFPGTYTVQKGDKLLEILNRAGGITEVGYTFGSVFTRKNVAKQQKISFERSADFLEQAVADAITSGNLGNISAEGLQPISILISRLRNISPIGRIVVEIDPLILKTDPQKNILLQDGDSLFVPKRPYSINVVGEVYSPTTHSFNSGISIEQYINKAGGLRNSADSSSIYVISPNGESYPVDRRSYSRGHSDLVPGSTIVVPRDPRPFDWLVLAKNVTPILANLATSAAAIASISAFNDYRNDYRSDN